MAHNKPGPVYIWISLNSTTKDWYLNRKYIYLLNLFFTPKYKPVCKKILIYDTLDFPPISGLKINLAISYNLIAFT